MQLLDFPGEEGAFFDTNSKESKVKHLFFLNSDSKAEDTWCYVSQLILYRRFLNLGRVWCREAEAIFFFLHIKRSTFDICVNIQFTLLHYILVQSLNRVWLFVTPWTAAGQDPLYTIISWNLLEYMSVELGILSNSLVLCCPLLLLFSMFPSIGVFSNESALCIRWPKYWSFSFGISPSRGYSKLISFKIDWFDLLEVQGTLKSLLQQHSSKVLYTVDIFSILFRLKYFSLYNMLFVLIWVT